MLNTKENRGALYGMTLEIILHDVLVAGGMYIKLTNGSLWQLNMLHPSFTVAINNICREIHDNELTKQDEPLILCTNIFAKYIEEVSLHYMPDDDSESTAVVSPFSSKHSEQVITNVLTSYYNAVNRIERRYQGLQYHSLLRPDMALFISTDGV